MKEYRVTWAIELDAENPEAAARAALDCITREGSIAHVFVVVPIKPSGDYQVHTIDLDAIDSNKEL